MINIRPTQGNRSRGVEHPATRAHILRIVEDLVRGMSPRQGRSTENSPLEDGVR